MEDNDKNSQEEKKSSGNEKIDVKAEKFIDEVLSSIQTKTEEFGKTISDYKSALQRPLSDVIETDTGFIVKFDLPGVEKDDIGLEITEDSIKIRVVFEDAAENGKYLQNERSQGKTKRSITLPAKIDVEKVKASFKNCILTIELPKIEKEFHKVDIS